MIAVVRVKVMGNKELFFCILVAIRSSSLIHIIHNSYAGYLHVIMQCNTKLTP